MHLSVTFKNLESSEYLKTYVQEKLNRMDKLLDHPGSADVVLKVEQQRRIAEISLASDHLNVHASEVNSEMQTAIDLLMDKVKKQITKGKEKVRDRRMRAKNRSPKNALWSEI